MNSCSDGAIGVMAVKRTIDGIHLHFAHNTDSFVSHKDETWSDVQANIITGFGIYGLRRRRTKLGHVAERIIKRHVRVRRKVLKVHPFEVYLGPAIVRASSPCQLWNKLTGVLVSFGEGNVSGLTEREMGIAMSVGYAYIRQQRG